MTDLAEIWTPRSTEAAVPSSGRAGYPLERVLVCVDHSPLAETCVRHAAVIARDLGGAMMVLYVMQPALSRGDLQRTDVLDWELSRHEASDYAERRGADAALLLGRPVEVRVEQGRPADRIASLAREWSADLTVLGAHGAHGTSAWSVGGTAQEVMARTRGSVLIARSSLAPHADAAATRILVALDGSASAESVLHAASRLARARGAELLLVLMIREPMDAAVLFTAEDLLVARGLAKRLESRAAAYLGGLRDRLIGQGAAARSVVLRTTDEGQSLYDLAQREQTDLIVLAASGASGNATVTCSSIAADLLARSAIPLLILQNRAEPGVHVWEHAPTSLAQRRELDRQP